MLPERTKEGQEACQARWTGAYPGPEGAVFHTVEVETLHSRLDTVVVAESLVAADLENAAAPYR